MKLSEFFNSIFIPLRIDAQQLDPKTKCSYEETISWWGKLTGDPSLELITDAICAQFITKLCKQKGKLGPVVKKSTVNKHAVNLKSIFRLAGPRSQYHLGQGLIPFVPYVPCPKVDHEAPNRHWSVEEVRSMYAHCDAATEPRLPNVTPREWWETCIVTDYYTGLRVKPLISFDTDMLVGQWLQLPPKICKQRRGQNQFVHEEALEHIQRICRPDRKVVLEYPRWETRRRIAYDQLRLIQTAAGIPKNLLSFCGEPL